MPGWWFFFGCLPFQTAWGRNSNIKDVLEELLWCITTQLTQGPPWTHLIQIQSANCADIASYSRMWVAGIQTFKSSWSSGCRVYLRDSIHVALQAAKNMRLKNIIDPPKFSISKHFYHRATAAKATIRSAKLQSWPHHDRVVSLRKPRRRSYTMLKTKSRNII